MDKLDTNLIHSHLKKMYRVFILIICANILVELAFTIRGFAIFDLARQKHRMYLYSYLFLLVTSAEALAALLIWKKKEKLSKFMFVHVYVYSACLIIWAAFVSCIDFIANGDSGIMVLVTIGMAVGALTRLKPRWFMLILSISTVGMLIGITLNSERELSIGFIINLLIFLALAWFISLQSYRLSVREFKSAQRLTELSITDQLTGMYNRRQLDNHIEERCEQNVPYLFMLFDADDFKVVNDTLGHATGDTYLILLAEKLKAYFGSNVYRFGGDEFSVISDMTAEEAAKAIDKLNAELAEIEGCVKFHVSAGITVVKAVSTLDEILVCADRALYQAKREGKTRWAIYA